MVGILESIVVLATTAGTINTTLKGITGFGAEDIVSNTMGDLVSDSIKSTVGRMGLQQKQVINHDLQQAFRAAIYEAIYDIGGKGCFPAAWKAARDVPAEVVYWPQGNLSPNDPDHLPDIRDASLERRLCLCLWKLGRAVKDETLFPLDPPLDDTHLPASVYHYLQPKTQQAEPVPGQDDDLYRYVARATPEQLSHEFFEMVLSQMQDDAAFAPLRSEDAEAIRFREHLRRHLLDRTLIHLGELLKSDDYTPAWRAFNRLLMEGLRDGVQRLETGQVAIKQSQETIKQMQEETLNRLDALLTQPADSTALAAWNSNLAGLVQATGRIEKRQQTSFVVLLKRMEGQHAEVMTGVSSIQDTLEQLIEQLADAQAIPDPYNVQGLPNPYLGLQPFTYAERAKYAGRDAQIAVALTKLTTPGEQRTLLFITGASGSGKSSFAQAGLIPALEQHYQQRHQTVRHAVFRPSKQPMAMLGDALLQLGMPGVQLWICCVATTQCTRCTPATRHAWGATGRFVCCRVPAHAGTHARSGEQRDRHRPVRGTLHAIGAGPA
jgi:hypothetical protein